MIMGLFGLFLSIAFVMIIIGLVKPEESAQALIGFFFLFLLAMTVVNGSLEYKTGVQNNRTNTLNSNGTVTSFTETSTDLYTNYQDSNTHYYGYYLAIAAAIGFILVLWGVKKGGFKVE